MLFHCVLDFAASRHVNPLPVLYSERAVWMPAAALIGLAGIVLWRGAPRGYRQISGFSGLILVLSAVTVLSIRHELVRTCWQTLDVAVRLSLAACWVAAVSGVVIVPLWLVRRAPSAPAPVRVKMWLAATLFIVPAETGVRVLHPGSHSMIALPDHWNTRQPRDDREFRIAAIGGSTMRGFPYEPKVDIPTVCRLHLEARYPERSFVVDNLAVTGVNFRGAVERLEVLEDRPDLIIVYTGHNEAFFDFDADVIRPESAVPLVDACFAWSAAYRTFSAGVPRLYRPDRELAHFGRKLFDAPLFPESVSRERLARFERTLVGFARSCREQEVRLIWFVPAADEGTFEPNRSHGRRAISTERQEEIRRRLEDARRLEQTARRDAAEQIYRQLLLEIPEFAEFHFRLGENLAAQGATAEARQSFQAAIDCDGYPCRATSDYRECIAGVARRERIPLIDAADVLSDASDSGLRDRSVIHDHVHPTLAGYFALGRAAAETVVRESMVAGNPSEPSTEPAPPDLGRLVNEVEFDEHDLATAYDRVAFALDHFADFRYDGERRLTEAAQYRLWANRLRTGEIQPGEQGTESLSQHLPGGVRFPSSE